MEINTQRMTPSHPNQAPALQNQGKAAGTAETAKPLVIADDIVTLSSQSTGQDDGQANVKGIGTGRPIKI